MSSTLPLTHRWRSHPDRWLFVVAWILIVAKCFAVAWAIERWAVPVAAAWIVVPTLIFAVLATIMWFVHRER